MLNIDQQNIGSSVQFPLFDKLIQKKKLLTCRNFLTKETTKGNVILKFESFASKEEEEEEGS